MITQRISTVFFLSFNPTLPKIFWEDKFSGLFKNDHNKILTEFTEYLAHLWQLLKAKCTQKSK